MDWKSVLGLIFILLVVLVFSGVLDNAIDSIRDKLYKRGGWLPRFVSKKAKNAADKIDAGECSTSTLSIMTEEKKKNNKTMDYEKKYKEALANMQELYNFMKYMSSTDAQYTTMSLENAFSELKESEDERIRKELIDIFKGKTAYTFEGDVKKYIAWLERQKPTTDIQNLTWEDIEKIGDFINTVQNENPNGIGAECLYTDVLERFLDGKQTKRKPVENSEKPSGNVIEKEDMTEYNKGFECGKQRVLKYPEEFGLCKNSDWSKEDETKLKSACALIRNTSLKGNGGVVDSTITWLKSLKDRVQPKQEWSEDYDGKISDLKTFIAKCNGFNRKNREIAFSMIDSLKPQPQWKPSEEQLINLAAILNDHRGNYVITSLYNDLKKL